MTDSELLARTSLGADLSPAARRALGARASVRRYAAGDVLWTAGTRIEHLTVVIDGCVRVVREGRGRQHVVHTEGPGGTLGEVPLFCGGPAPATAIAVVPTRCLIITRSAIDAALSVDPTVAWSLLRGLAGRVRDLVGRLDRLALESATARLAGLLLERAARADGDVVALGMTQTAVAAELGTVREVVVRSLRTLREAGLIAPAGRGRVRVIDLATLRELAEAGRR